MKARARYQLSFARYCYPEPLVFTRYDDQWYATYKGSVLGGNHYECDMLHKWIWQGIDKTVRAQ